MLFPVLLLLLFVISVLCVIYTVLEWIKWSI